MRPHRAQHMVNDRQGIFGAELGSFSVPDEAGAEREAKALLYVGASEARLLQSSRMSIAPCKMSHVAGVPKQADASARLSRERLPVPGVITKSPPVAYCHLLIIQRRSNTNDAGIARIQGHFHAVHPERTVYTKAINGKRESFVSQRQQIGCHRRVIFPAPWLPLGTARHMLASRPLDGRTEEQPC